MPHASSLEESRIPKFFVYGKSGSGKTSLFRQLPGRKFLYMFDPAGLNSLMHDDDIQYEEFLVDAMALGVSTLKGVRDSGSPTAEVMDVYNKWEDDFNERCSKNWWNDPTVEIDGVKGGFDVIGFDSLTTLSDLIMDRILQINQRAGKAPEISDYGMLANAIARVVRKASATNKIIYFTGHEQAVQDKLMRTISIDIMVTGQLKSKLPMLFSDIYHCSGTMSEKGKPEFKILTTPDEFFGICRGSNPLRRAGLGYTHDVTIDAAKAATLQGIGPLVSQVTGLK